VIAKNVLPVFDEDCVYMVRVIRPGFEQVRTLLAVRNGYLFEAKFLVSGNEEGLKAMLQSNDVQVSKIKDPFE
jgi:hypothetical protein